MKKMKNEVMLRIRNAEVLDRLQEMFEKTKFKSINEFLNYLLEEAVFRPINSEEIKNDLRSFDLYLRNIWDMVKDIDDTLDRQYRS